MNFQKWELFSGSSGISWFPKEWNEARKRPSFNSLPFDCAMSASLISSLSFKLPSEISEDQISPQAFNRALVVSLINYDIPPNELSLVPSTL